jgi:hypothetical protein
MIMLMLMLMHQKTDDQIVREVRRHTTGNRAAIEASKYAGCVSCCKVFAPVKVVAWYDEWTSPEKRNRVQRWTATCPYCGKGSVIGSVTGLLDDQAYLPVTHMILQKVSGAVKPHAR